MHLRPYQSQLVTEIRGQYQLGHKAVLAVLPTGGGKTVCFAHIAQAASVKGNRVLVLVHRQELLDQASRAMPVPHGIIAANRAMDLSHTVQVASVQTVARRLHLLPRDFFQLLVVDEAHHTTAGTWARVIAHFHGAKLLGVTATPIRGDGRGLGERYQAMVQGPTAAELASEGYLAPARVLAPPGFDSAGLRKRMGDFDTKQAEQRVGTIMAASIDDTMDAGTRRELLQRLAVGDLKVLTSCALIGEGVDVPSVGGCILLRPTASVGLHLQMIGRCLRPQPGKTAVVLDHVGNTLRLGHHLEERDWTLDGLRKRDRDAAPSVKVCPQCFSTSTSTAQICRDCGHVFAPPERRELKQVEGELVEHSALPPLGAYKKGDIVRDLTLTKNTYVVLGVVAKLKRLMVTNIEHANKLDIAAGFGVPVSEVEFVSRPSKERKQEQGKAQSLQGLIALGHSRGYKNAVAWAKHVMHARSSK